MNKSINHPYDELLTAYSAGSLPLSQALCISTHLEHCQSRGQKLQRLNRVGSQLMQQLKPSPASAELKSRLLDRLDSLTGEQSPAASKPSESDSSIPRCLRQFVENGMSTCPGGVCLPIFTVSSCAVTATVPGLNC